MDPHPGTVKSGLVESTLEQTVYRSLDPNLHEIRLLRILPGRDGQVLHCNLIHDTLIHSQSYEALSYVWGDVQAKEAIFVDGRPATVTQNLFEALMHLRLVEEVRIMWIDFICINQDDPLERASQVTQMWNIYSTAKRVMIWLGEHRDGSEGAIRFLREFETVKGDEAWLQSLKWTETRMGDLAAVVMLVSRPYFYRVWVMQEVAAAREVMVLCGDTCIPYDNIMRFSKVAFLAGQHPGSSAVESIYTGPRHHFAAMQHRGPLSLPEPGQTHICGSDSYPRDMLYHMARSMKKGATDPRDRIYGILGVLDFPPGLKKRLCVDYTISTPELYQNFARMLVEETQRLDILTYCHKFTSKPRGVTHLAGLPSWVPDWSSLAKGGPHDVNGGVDEISMKGVLCMLDDLPDSNAGGQPESLRVKFSSDASSMTVQGLCLGLINFRLPPFALGPQGMRSACKDVVRYLLCCRELLLLTLRRWQTTTRATPASDIVDKYISQAGEVVFDSLGFRLGELEVPTKEWMTSWIADTQAGRELEITQEQETVLLMYNLMLFGRYFFVSLSGFPGELTGAKTAQHKPLVPSFIGFAPEAAQPDDAVCLIAGCRLPIILRMIPEGFVVIGDSVVQSVVTSDGTDLDVMRGDFMDGPSAPQLQTWYRLC